MAVTASTQADILVRLIHPDRDDLPEAAARFILALDLSPEDHEHVDDLAAKARAGTLTPAEQEELDNYERVNNLIGILKSKARRSLKRIHSNPTY